MAPTTKKKGDNGANLGFEAKLFLAADKLRGNMDASEYKHVVLGLVFLKYISDAFESKRDDLVREAADPDRDLYVIAPSERLMIAEDRDEYLAENVFWVPKEARWSYLQANAKQPTIGKLIDDAMLALETSNASLKGVHLAPSGTAASCWLTAPCRPPSPARATSARPWSRPMSSIA